MKKTINKKATMLLTIGLFVIALTPIASRYLKTSDITNGIGYGAGIGLILLALRSFTSKSNQK